jgi:hypothetical protein
MELVRFPLRELMRMMRLCVQNLCLTAAFIFLCDKYLKLIFLHQRPLSQNNEKKPKKKKYKKQDLKKLDGDFKHYSITKKKNWLKDFGPFFERPARVKRSVI